MSAAATLRLYGDRSGFGAHCVLAFAKALGVELELLWSPPPTPASPDQRPTLCGPTGSIGGVKSICAFLAQTHAQAAKSAFPLLLEQQQEEQKQKYWQEQQAIDFVLLELQPALAGIDKPRISAVLDQFEDQLGSAGDSAASASLLSNMLCASAFRFFKWSGLPTDWPLISKLVQQQQDKHAKAFAFAAAAAPLPAPLAAPLLTRAVLAGGAPAAAGKQEKQNYYLTTAIAYTNGAPHMGHAYEAVSADCIARHHRRAGFDLHFVTGTDEHGLKIATAAAAEGFESTLKFCDKHAAGFKRLLRTVNASEDFFIRTSHPKHHEVCQWVWRKCREQGDIYLGTYEGWYLQREEAFISETEAKALDYKDPVSQKPLEKMQEESYFFRMSKYQDRLIEHIKNNPSFICPAEKRNEILKRLAEPLTDLSCSRASFTWGVPVPDDERHVMYVWFDALVNYVSALHPLEKDGGLIRRWPATVHLIGKDITWFHCVIWPTILMSAGLEIPLKVFSHGFVLGADGEKMSKSLGNGVDPFDAVAQYSSDTFRFFLLKESTFGSDLRFDTQSLVTSHNADLANAIGNLVHRLAALTAKFCDGRVPAPLAASGSSSGSPSRPPPLDLAQLQQQTRSAFDELQLREAVETAMAGVRDLNKFLTDAAPWANPDAATRAEDIRLGLESLYVLAHFLEPFIPEACGKIWERLNTKPRLLPELSPWFENLATGTPVDATAAVLFTPIASAGSGAKAQLPVQRLDLRVAYASKAEVHAQQDPKTPPCVVISFLLQDPEVQAQQTRTAVLRLSTAAAAAAAAAALGGKKFIVASNVKEPVVQGVNPSLTVIAPLSTDQQVYLLQPADPSCPVGAAVSIEGHPALPKPNDKLKPQELQQHLLQQLQQQKGGNVYFNALPFNCTTSSGAGCGGIAAFSLPQ